MPPVLTSTNLNVLPPVDDSPKTRCPFTVYAQLGSTNVPDELMQELEEEIQKPTGIWTVKPPQLKMEIVLLSRECGIMYELTNIEGVRSVLLLVPREGD